LPLAHKYKPHEPCLFTKLPRKPLLGNQALRT
jgi:hypothetical protein